LTVYNLRNKEQFRLPSGEGEVRVAFSPRATLLAIASRTGSRRASFTPATTQDQYRVQLWDVTTRKLQWEQDFSGFAINGLSFSDDGQRLVVGCGRTRSRDALGEISIWRVSDGVKLAGWAGGSIGAGTSVSWFAATRDASAAAVITFPNRLSVIDLTTGQERWSAPATDERPQRLAFSPDGRVLASGAAFTDTDIRLWDAATGRDLGRLQGQRGFTSGLEFLADGRHLVSCSGDQTLRLWDLETRTQMRAFRGHKTEVHSLAISADQQTLFSGCKDGSAYVWDLNSQHNAATSGTISERFLAWAFADGSDAIVTVDGDGQVKLRQGREFQEEIPLLELGRDGVSGADPVFDRKRPLLAVVTATRKVQVWDWRHRRLVREWAENSEQGARQSRGVPRAFSADGSTLLVAPPLTETGAEKLLYRE
jgi:WD40 repeat protein